MGTRTSDLTLVSEVRHDGYVNPRDVNHRLHGGSWATRSSSWILSTTGPLC